MFKCLYYRKPFTTKRDLSNHLNVCLIYNASIDWVFPYVPPSGPREILSYDAVSVVPLLCQCQAYSRPLVSGFALPCGPDSNPLFK